jgi:hypothetical protein
VLERELERRAHVRLVLREARVGAVEQLVQALLGVAAGGATPGEGAELHGRPALETRSRGPRVGLIEWPGANA